MVEQGLRATTPPPGRSAPPPSTPDQARQIELNRLKAKFNQRQKEQEASASTSLNANGKRPLTSTAATSTSPTAPGKAPLKPSAMIGKYYDYDLSKMVNSKGGFLVEDGKEVDEEVIRKAKEREKQRLQQNQELPIYHDPALNPKCNECQSIYIDPLFKNVFSCLVCKRCQNEKPEKYSLLTKTECRELRDQELLPHLLKANPHQVTYSNMMLFLRYQVEAFAWKKWGSPEALDAEWERRVAEKKKKKNKKFEQGLKELRKRTKEGIWQRRKDEEHKHVFSQIEDANRSAMNAAEHEQISTALEVEQLESLWLPLRARGVFGGQVISQALVSATNCVDPAFALHSLHCYFLTSASPSTPIVYEVERLRQGRSYVTRAVKAVQNGRIIFVMMCSFQKPEPWQPSHQWEMPSVPPPEECELEEDRFTRRLSVESYDIKKRYQDLIQERSKSPIAIKVAKEHEVSADGTVRYMYWMQARDIPKYEAPFQKCILSYISDLYLISSASRILGLKRYGRGPGTVSMTSSIDHSIYFYNNSFDCGDWLLHVMVSPRTGSGRGMVHGRMYTRDGTLVAVTSQEGVVRADVRDPSEPVASKL
ncbi:thioesterase-like superfamily-domain-containing protein [Infundibulicybe gibba]|nr:thioesterase-like superfamily-domain-containing protein [Infundibulicybe gibba]